MLHFGAVYPNQSCEMQKACSIEKEVARCPKVERGTSNELSFLAGRFAADRFGGRKRVLSLEGSYFKVGGGRMELLEFP